MCGIFGVWQRQGQPLDVITVQEATSRLHHRGPDDEGYLLVNTQTGALLACGGQDTDPQLQLPPLTHAQGMPFDFALGFRRLAILDLSPAGHQPMCSADGRFWIVFNGEIYNYVELRAELKQRGHYFYSGSDTEVLLAAYAQWGAAMLTRLIGMFAFAILDQEAGRLFLARDFFGIKPLYYTLSGGQFAFASEIKALLVLPGVTRRVNPQRLYAYLRFGFTDQGAETMFADVRQLPSAHALEVNLRTGTVGEPQRYWRLRADQPLEISFADAAAKVRELFLENVRLHLRSDVPVGSCLSGGIDSSSIVLAMRQLEGPGLDLHTFSAVFADAIIGEEKYVDIAAAAAQSIVHKTQPTAAELVADLDHLITIQEEPFGSTSIYAQERVFRLAQEAGIKVMLDGQGADEMMAGYRPYINARLASLLQQGHWQMAWRFWQRAAALPGASHSTLIQGAARWLLPPTLQTPFRRFVGKELDPAWLNQDWFRQHKVDFVWDRPIRGDHLLRQVLYEDMTGISLPMLLRYEDRNSMAHSIESRVPFLTPTLVQFMFSLPEEFLINTDGVSKAVLRSALRGVTPDVILDRRDKIGFATPEQAWLTTLKPWVDQTLAAGVRQDVAALNVKAAKQEWEQVAIGNKPFDRKIWRWMNVLRWIEIYQVTS